MSYFIINKQPVFLSWSRYKQIREEALKGKDAIYKISSTIAGHKETKETQKLMYEVLKAKYDKDPKQFYSEWVKFDIVGDDASRNVWDLLYDYCHYYGYAYLSDLRDFTQKLADDYEGDSYAYPMGQLFALIHLVKPTRRWWKYTHKMTGRIVKLIIISENVHRLVGDLTNFTIFTKDFQIRCGRDFEILPLL